MAWVEGYSAKWWVANNLPSYRLATRDDLQPNAIIYKTCRDRDGYPQGPDAIRLSDKPIQEGEFYGTQETLLVGEWLDGSWRSDKYFRYPLGDHLFSDENHVVILLVKKT